VHLKLIEKSNRKLRFRNTRGRGWVFVAIGVLLAGASLSASGASALITALFCMACLGAGGWVVLRRAEITLDLLARRFDGRRGYWPSPRTYGGSLDRIECVRLRRSRRQRADGTAADIDDCDWLVCLELPDWPPMVVFWSRNETKAVEPSEPPADGSIIWRDDNGLATIELARGGYLRGAWFPLLFGSAFLTAGGILLSSATGLLPFLPSQGFAWIGGTLFSLAGEQTQLWLCRTLQQLVAR